jgi:hypothetical protein
MKKTASDVKVESKASASNQAAPQGADEQLNAQIRQLQ